MASYSVCILSMNSNKMSSSCNSASSSMRDAAACLAELAYRAEALTQRQALEKQEAVMIERRKEEESQCRMELEEMKWKREMKEVEMELGAAKARFDAMQYYDDSASEGKVSFRKLPL